MSRELTPMLESERVLLKGKSYEEKARYRMGFPLAAAL